MHLTQDSISMLIYDAEDSSDPGPDPDTAMVLHIPIDQVRCLIQASAEKHTLSPLLCTVIFFCLSSCSFGYTCPSPMEMFVHSLLQMPDGAKNELFCEMQFEDTLNSGTFPYPLEKARALVFPALCKCSLGCMQQLDAA